MTPRAWIGATACALLLLSALPAASKDKQLAAPRLDPDVTGESKPAGSGRSEAWVAPPPKTIDIPDKCAASIRKACPSAFKGVRELQACLRTRASRIPRSCLHDVETQLDGSAGAPAHASAPGSAGGRGARVVRAAKPPSFKPATVKQARALVIKDCKPDAQEFCSDLTKTDEADVVSCLKAYAGQASASCSASIDDLVKLEGD